MKKFTVLLIILFLASLNVNAATYTIKKDGNIQNPNGRIQRKINTNTSNQYSQTVRNNYNSADKDDDVIYTKAQEPEITQPAETKHKIINRNSVSPNVDKEKSQNEEYLKLSDPNINIYSIVTKHYRDSDAAINKQAALNNKKSTNGCRITTFSYGTEYGIYCPYDKDYAYYYKSFDDPVLTRFAYIKYISSNINLMYEYKKNSSNNWVLYSKVIEYYNSPLKQFVYNKVNNSYVLEGYYIGNKKYSPEGKLQHTRNTWQQ